MRVNDSNLILPAGDVRIGPKDYNIYANSQVPTPNDVNSIPLKTVGNASILVGDVGHAVDGGQLQTNIVRVDGQHSVYIPVLKQGGGANTITIVDGIRKATAHLLDIPASLKTAVVFDQSVFVKTAIKNVISEGAIGLCLTGIMILLFLGNVRATIAVLLSIPISCIATFLILNAFGDSINTMVLGGMALVLSRLIDNSVVVLENIFRHFEMGENSVKASEEGGKEVALAVLGGNIQHGYRVLPGCASHWREQVPVHGAGPRRCDRVVLLLRGRNDRGATLLFKVHQGDWARNGARIGRARRPGSRAYARQPKHKNLFARVVYHFNEGFWLAAGDDTTAQSTSALGGRYWSWSLLCVRHCSALRCRPSWGKHTFRARTLDSSSSVSKLQRAPESN